MGYSRTIDLPSFLEGEYYKREFFKNNIYDILYKYINNKYILDSSLICESNRKIHDIKVVRCGKYLQFYFYSKKRYAADKNLEKIVYNRLIHEQITVTPSAKEYEPKEIELKNVNRSKFQLQNLVKSNMESFKTFITLTFEENITDIKSANKKFHIFRRNLKRLKPDLKYVCVPEFQKRGAVHYHLMTNIEYDDFKILSKEERKIWNKSSGWNIGRDVKGWIYGHNMAKDMKTINVVGYITKYMTKDVDNRLFGKHRYFYSQNLEKPEELLLDMSQFKDNSRFEIIKIFNGLEEMTYSKKYQDMFGDDVMFVEYKIGG